MAENLDVPSFGNFSIEDTMELTATKELIDTFLSTDAATAAPDKLTTIDKTTEKKTNTTDKTTTKAPEKKEEGPNAEKLVNSFLSDGEEEEEQPEEKVAEEKEEDRETTPEENKFSALSKDLFKLGVFSKEDEEEAEISTPEDFLERFQLEGKKKANEMLSNFLGQFGEDYQNAFQSIFVKGVNPKEYFGVYNNVQDFSTIDLKTEANQIAVIQKALFDQGLEPEDITAEVERLKNYGDLEPVAQRHHKVLIKKEAAKIAQMEQDSEAKLQHQASLRNQYIKNVNTVLQDKLKNKEFDGIPINPKLAQELQDYLVTDKYKTPSGETLTEFDKTILELKRPENHERKVKVALLLKILEKDPTLSTIQKAGVSKKTDALFSEVTRTSSKTSVKGEKEKVKPGSWFTN